jgi:hypothetical protein
MTASPRDLEQVRALVALAANVATPHAEAAAAALQAVKRIHKYDLLSLEAARLARDLVREAEEDARAARSPKTEGVRGASGLLTRIDVILMIMSESPIAYRFARMKSNFRTVGSPVVGWIRKKYIHRAVWASDAIAKEYSTSGRRIVEALIVPQEVAIEVQKIVFGEVR